MTRRVTPALLVAVALAGCGTSSLSAVQLRTAATRVCTVAGRRLSRIRPPGLPAQGSTFLRRGIAALKPELAALGRLSPPGDLAAHFNGARAATAKMLKLLQSTLQGLKAGNDPVVAIKTLQQELIGPEAQAAAAWHAAEIPACAPR